MLLATLSVCSIFRTKNEIKKSGTSKKKPKSGSLQEKSTSWAMKSATNSAKRSFKSALNSSQPGCEGTSWSTHPLTRPRTRYMRSCCTNQTRYGTNSLQVNISTNRGWMKFRTRRSSRSSKYSKISKFRNISPSLLLRLLNNRKSNFRSNNQRPSSPSSLFLH